jgi:hypothetical protein
LRRIPLGQDSIVLDLESIDPGALRSDDFHHLLQMLQQPLRVSRKIVQRQRHGVILLTA